SELARGSARTPSERSWASKSAWTAARSLRLFSHAASRKAFRSAAGRSRASRKRDSSDIARFLTLRSIPRQSPLLVNATEGSRQRHGIFGNSSGRCFSLDFSAQPGSCVGPVAIHASWRKAKRRGGLVSGQPCEVTQFDNLGFDRVKRGQL